MFRGNYPARLSTAGRLLVPRAFRRQLFASSRPLSYPMVIVAAPGHHISLIPSYSLPSFVKRWAQDVEEGLITTDQLLEVLKHFGIGPSVPLFESNCLERGLEEVGETIQAEWSKHYPSLDRRKGKEFEKFLATIFSAHGFEVLENIRLLGAEIDLLLIQTSADGRTILVEAKNYAAKRKVTLAQVMRLYGLREALYDLLPVSDTFLVTTSTFPKPAQLFGEIFHIGLMDVNRLMKWLAAFPKPPVLRLPVVGICQMDSRWSIKLSHKMLRHLLPSPSGEVAVLGGLEYLDLVSPEVLLE